MPSHKFPTPAPRRGERQSRDKAAGETPIQKSRNIPENRHDRPGDTRPKTRENRPGSAPEKRGESGTFSRREAWKKKYKKNETIAENEENTSFSPSLPEDAESPLQPGIKPVTELLEADPAKIDAVFLRKGRKGPETGRIIDLCREHGVRFSLVDDVFLDRLWKGRHQGVIARLFPTGFTELPALLECAPDAPLPLILALDQVQDPGNAGTLARTLYAMGGAGLIVPKHNGVYLGAAAARVAAGALEKLPVAKPANLAQALDAAIEAGFAIYGADAQGPSDGADAESVFTVIPRLPAVLVLGGEDGGIRPIIRKRCTAMVSIPFLREFDSLNVAQAGAIIIAAFAASRSK